MNDVRLPRLPNRRRGTTAWNENDIRIADLLRRYPGGITLPELARLSGISYTAIDNALYHLERRGFILCEDYHLISLYQP